MLTRSGNGSVGKVVAGGNQVVIVGIWAPGRALHSYAFKALRTRPVSIPIPGAESGVHVHVSHHPKIGVPIDYLNEPHQFAL